MPWKTRKKSLKLTPQTEGNYRWFEKGIYKQRSILGRSAKPGLIHTELHIYNKLLNMDRAYFFSGRQTPLPSRQGERKSLDTASQLWGGIPPERRPLCLRVKRRSGLLICPLDKSNPLPRLHHLRKKLLGSLISSSYIPLPENGLISLKRFFFFRSTFKERKVRKKPHKPCC